ncbi:MAG: hypothetical protein AAFZ01_09640 [Pseudomonadota bacterium]
MIARTIYRLTSFCMGLAAYAVVAHAATFSADGAWCSPAGERVVIDGADVTTPGGQKSAGRYTEHAYVFTVPKGERDGGKDLYFEPIGPNAMKVTTIAPVQIEPGPHDDWERCRGATS